MNTVAMEESIALVRSGMAHLEKRYEEQQQGVDLTPVDFQPFYDTLADDVIFHVPTTSGARDGDTSKPPWNVLGRAHQGKQALIEAFEAEQSLLTNWEIKRPLEYFANADGSRVVVLHGERYRMVGKEVPWSESAMVFDVRNGQITRYTHLADLSGHILATEGTTR